MKVKTAKTRGKHRVNVMLPMEIFRAGKRLAKQDRRSFSNLIEVLISSEVNRPKAA